MLHNKEPVKPDAVKTELSQLSTTLTVGAEGIAFGAAVPPPGELVHPLTDCVTVYVPPLVTVIEDVVAPVLHNKEPVKADAVSIELPQLSVTDTVGDATAELIGAAIPLPATLVQPLIV